MNHILAIAACVTAAGVLLHGSAAGQPRDWGPTRAAAESLPRLHSLLVSHRGGLVFEYYARGHGAARLANIKSASKSVISTLVGIAIERKLIPDLDTPIVRWFPELRTDADTRKQAITIEDLLTMRSGLASTSGGNYGRWVTSANWVRHALSRPMVSDPGTSMEYSTGTSHILSAILTKVSKASTHAFAVETLATPLGITLARWPRDPQGIYFGGNEMLMTGRQMIAFGELYRSRGRAGGRQVVPAEWVHPLPEDLPPRRAVLAANLETALNGLWDGRPHVGDRIVVIGAGTVGCLVAWLAARIAGCQVVLVDVNPERAAVARQLGVGFAHPDEAAADADLVMHASGTADGLGAALRLAGLEATIVELSWFGNRAVPLPLGESFHARRLSITSSQVGRVAPSQRARWDTARRMRLVLDLLRDSVLDALLTGETAFDDMPQVMAALASGQRSALCHVITYG